jgi:hypothetical protein
VPALEVAAEPALVPEPPTLEGPEPPLSLSDAPALPPTAPWPGFPVSGSDADEQPRRRARAETTAAGLRCRVLMRMVWILHAGAGHFDHYECPERIHGKFR